MSFRTYQQLQKDVVSWSLKLPRDYDVIIGIPRSGMLPALYLSLHMNIAMSSLDIFAADRQLLETGERYGDRLDKQAGLHTATWRPQKVLVVDDCIASGKSIRRAKQLLVDFQDLTIDYGCVYCEPGKEKELDHFHEVLEFCAIFEWNMMHSWYLMKHACVDIDGVLCEDPTSSQDDDGPAYLDFLENAKPLHVPSVKIGHLVTCRLAKYESETQQWLARQGIQYNQLTLMDHPNKEARQAAGNHAIYKAEVYQQSGAAIFIESSAHEAAQIFKITGKPVYCVANQTLHQGSAQDKRLYSFFRGHLTRPEALHG